MATLSRFPLPALLRPAPLRRRLWQGGALLAAFIVTLVVGNRVLLSTSPDKSVGTRMLGHDFLAFYTAGAFVRDGRMGELYNLDSVKDFQHQLAQEAGLEISHDFGPFWNPPLYAMVFAPLAALPYRSALGVWTAFNVAALCAALVLLIRMLEGREGGLAAPASASASWSSSVWAWTRDWRNALLVPLLLLVSMPFIQALSHGQNTFTSLLLVCAIVTFWRKESPIFAGAACGLLLYKPQLAAVLAVALVISMGPRVLIGLVAALSCGAIMTVMSMPGMLHVYADALPKNVHFMQVEHDYLWERHATLKAFFRLFFQGRDAGEMQLLPKTMWLASEALLAGGLCVALWRSRSANARRLPDDPWTGETRATRRDRLIAATVAATPLLMPFYFDYDLLLLAVPATLLARERLLRSAGAKTATSERVLLGAWIAMFCWLLVNPGIARSTGVNITVPLLTTVAVLHVFRAAKRPQMTQAQALAAVKLEPLPQALEHRSRRAA